MAHGVPAADAARARLGGARSAILAWLFIACVDAVALAFMAPPATFGTRLIHHGVDFFQLLALGVFSWLLVRGVSRVARGRTLVPVIALSLAAAVVAVFALSPDFESFAVRMKRPWLEAVGAVLTSLALPASFLAGRMLDRPRLRLVALAGAVALLGMHHLLLPGDYEGIHLYWVLSAGTLLGAAFAGASVPRVVLETPARPAARWALFGALAVPALGSLAWWPPPAVVSRAFQVSGSALFPFLAKVPRAKPKTVDDAKLARWIDERWMSRSPATKPVRASSPSISPKNPILILLVMDSLRADVVAEERKANRLRHLNRLARESVSFTQARSPGAGTKHSMGSIFTGRYAARLRWRKDKLVAGGDRLGELLHKKGFHTVHISAYPSIAQGSGVLGTFDREVVAKPRPGQEYALSQEVLPLGLKEIESAKDEPLFLYMHWLDAHYPYDSVGGPGPSKMEGYIREMGECDRKLGELRDALERMGVWDRVVLVVTADHGEGFGDHGVFAHGKGLYESILRVPLIIRVPGVAPAVIDTPVSGIDIGPTLLDLASRSTPGEFLGESLVGFLRGGRPELGRPIAAALKAAKAGVFGQYKVIDDERKNTVEVYDLSNDPTERVNLYGTLAGKDEEMRAALNRFFSPPPRRPAAPARATASTAKR
jgi:hypothetical protein